MAESEEIVTFALPQLTDPMMPRICNVCGAMVIDSQQWIARHRAWHETLIDESAGHE